MDKNLIEVTIEEERKTQIEILDEVAAFCKKNNLKYYLIAGSLLGAVRHKGYIPWDDDIDIVMCRKDYNFFNEKFDSQDYYLVNNIKNLSYHAPFAKVCKNNTLVESTAKDDVSIGVNIDVFPIDNLPDDQRKQRKIINHIQLMKKILALKYVGIVKEQKFNKKIILVISHAVLKLIPTKAIIDSIINTATRYEDCDGSYCAELVWCCGEREIVHRHVFSETIKMEFEGKEYDCPIGWDEWLSKRYGDYMKLPPKEQQKTHHRVKAYYLE